MRFPVTTHCHCQFPTGNQQPFLLTSLSLPRFQIALGLIPTRTWSDMKDFQSWGLHEARSSFGIIWRWEPAGWTVSRPVNHAVSQDRWKCKSTYHPRLLQDYFHLAHVHGEKQNCSPANETDCNRNPWALSWSSVHVAEQSFSKQDKLGLISRVCWRYRGGRRRRKGHGKKDGESGCFGLFIKSSNSKLTWCDYRCWSSVSLGFSDVDKRLQWWKPSLLLIGPCPIC